jgi:succinate-acetate transporter protein
MEALLVLLVFIVVVLAFAFGWQSYKNAMLIKQVRGMTHVYSMVSEMYTSLADTVMMHEGIDIKPYIEAIAEGGNINGKHL